jgi:hypothetical protein
MLPIAEVSLVYEDMSNFGVALDGCAAIFDATTIQALPKMLTDFTLLQTTKFAKAVSTNTFDTGQIAALRALLNFTSLAEVRICLSTGNNMGTLHQLPRVI